VIKCLTWKLKALTRNVFTQTMTSFRETPLSSSSECDVQLLQNCQRESSTSDDVPKITLETIEENLPSDVVPKETVSPKIEENSISDVVPKIETVSPKIEENSPSNVVQKIETVSPSMTLLKTEEISQKAEEHKNVQQISHEKYRQVNYQRNSSLIDPPINYICNRCHQPGHFMKNCPMANVLKITGIPIEDLVETTADHPYAMFHPSGKFMIHRMHVNARVGSRGRSSIHFTHDESRKSIEAEGEVEKQSHPELICPICRELMSEAVVMICCGFSFCSVCIQTSIIEDPSQKCPGEGCSKLISIDSMVHNVHLRKVISAYQMEKSGEPDSNIASAYTIKKSPN